MTENLYHEAVYEQLTGKFSATYWKLLKTFLGVAKDTEMKDTLERIHPGKCKDKIPNWTKFKEKITDTDSYYACEMSR